MLGYIPRAVQLKLFRYALSKLDFLDHSTYDVERDFNLSLGLKNELEMKNLGLNVTKLSTTLNLPSNIRLHDARVSTLHIRIPTDFHRAPVRVSISTVVIDGEIVNETTATGPVRGSRSDDVSGSDSLHSLDIRDGFKIPSGIDLTSSFLQERPTEAKEVDAVLQSKFEDPLPSENDFEEEDSIDDSGLGTPLGFWNFVPSFFQRLVDRVEIAIEDISLRMKVSFSAAPQGSNVNFLTLIFSIDSIEIEGVFANSDSTTQNRVVSRVNKPGMRAVRIDGIGLSLSGDPGFFEDPSFLAPPDPKETGTVALDGTVLPSAAAPARVAVGGSANLETSREIHPTSSQHLCDSDSDTAHNSVRDHEAIGTDYRPFFAQMQEPNQTHPQTPPPSHPTAASPQNLFSPSSSFHGSIGSEDIGSRILSQSFLHPESDTGLSQSNPNPDVLNTEDRLHELRYSGGIEPTGRTVPHHSESESDTDSLENEPRRFDLFQEPNTKFLGVTPTVAPRTTDPDPELQNRTQTSGQGTTRLCSHIAEPVPRLAPSMTISQTLSNLEPVEASVQPIGEFTYYQGTPDSIEYSNPDLRYLSQSVHSTTSSISNDDTRGHLSIEPSGATDTIMEPQVIYALSDGELSENSSVYESYPPSESDEIPAFASAILPLNQLTPGNSSTPPEDQGTPYTTKSPATGTQESGIGTCSQIQVGDDNDHQKASRSTAIPIQNQAPPSPLDFPRHIPPIEEIDFQAQGTEESGSEGSESVLAESMIFTHEEAGSLYLSALGGPRPLGPPLPILVEQSETVSSNPSPDICTPRLMIYKQIFRVDYMDIFVPGIASSINNTRVGHEPVATPSIDMSESVLPTMPGAFSVYAASRSERKRGSDPLAVSQLTRSNPRPSVSFKLLEESSTECPRQRSPDQSLTPPPRGRIELEIGEIDISIDLIVGRKISTLITQATRGTDSDVQTLPKADVARKTNNPDVVLSVTSLKVRLANRMPGFTAPPWHQSPETRQPRSTVHRDLPHDSRYPKSLDILVVSMNGVHIRHRTSDIIDEPSSFSEISVGSCSVDIGEQHILKFHPNQDTNEYRKGRTRIPDQVFVLHIDDTREKRHVRIQSAAINFYFPVQELETTLACFGGLENILNITPAPGISSKGHNLKPGEPADTDARGGYTGSAKTTLLVVDIKGINIEVFVSSVAGGVGLSTSPIRITTNDSGGLAVKLAKLAVFGPNIGDINNAGPAVSVLELKSINVNLDNSPTEEDLERLLKMIVPSTDGYGDDDSVMVDILLRQRRRGSVLRVDIGQTKGNLPDSCDLSRFKAVAGELAKMATVAKYIPQDERPGMLALISVDNVSFTIFPEEEPHSFTAGLKTIDICHVAAPSLFALSIQKVDLTRQPAKASEVWVGESLHRSLATSGQEYKNRPMIKVRMIGDEPEPEIKIKVWNTRFEYHAESLFELLSLTSKDTHNIATTSIDDPATNSADKEAIGQSHRPGSSQDKPTVSNPPPLRLDIGLSGVSVALNPFHSASRALLIVHEGSFVCGLSAHGPFSASLVLVKANLVAIDNRTNLVDPKIQSLENRTHKRNPTEELSHYTSQGYVPVLTATSAKVHLKINAHGTEGETAMLANVEDAFIFIESCADSTQTIIEVLNGIKPPLPESEEIKYMTQIMPIDVFANLDENAFMPADAPFIGGNPRNLKSLQEIPEDLFEDEIPFNSQLIESYYPYSDLPKANLPSIPRPAPGNFHDQVCVVAEEPLVFDEQYIKSPSKEPQGARTKVVPREVTLKVCVRNTQLIWNLHDGYDWKKTRDTISKAVKKVEERAFRRRRRHMDMQRGQEEDDDDEEEEEEEGDGESATYDVLFNSIYITLPSHRDPKDLSKDIQNQIRGNYDLQSETGSYTQTVMTADSPYSPGPRNSQARRRDQKYQRSKRNAMQFELKGVDVDFTVFNPDGLEIQTSLDVRVNDVQVTENVRTSTWKMFLTYMREAGVRERGLPMAHIHVDTLRPIPELAATELSIKVKLLPLRLYVDQDALEFLTRFFEFKDPDILKPGVKQEEPFIQRCEIDTVRVKLDFKPKRVDYAGLRSGRTTEFMNFFILEEADMELRHVALNGVSGFERLGKDLNNIWMPDIKQNQLGGVVAGVAPFRSLVNIGTGVRDLVKVPIMEYRKDGRLVRSIKKGTQHFVKTSGSEVARLGAKLAIGTQTFLERTEEFLVGDVAQPRQHSHSREGHPNDEDGDAGATAFSPYADQPLGVYNGLVQARRGLTRNLNEAKEAIMRVPSEAAQGGSAKGAAAAVFRAAPTAVIRPMIGVTEAVHKTLHGIDNTIDKEKREKIRDKYKKRSS
ncbi:autophagy- protein 2 [Orbilia blumenaviensis]|uniref:Autophagy-related protein 2 n=1 Tax=Orbilia blumenaviensis TaxID=1796055 RepID=A0AAV9UDA4_9PEZI